MIVMLYLRDAEEEGDDPGGGDHGVGLGRRPRAVGERVANHLKCATCTQ